MQKVCENLNFSSHFSQMTLLRKTLATSQKSLGLSVSKMVLMAMLFHNFQYGDMDNSARLLNQRHLYYVRNKFGCDPFSLAFKRMAVHLETFH